jgi:non-heme chloroperoxidase
MKKQLRWSGMRKAAAAILGALLLLAVVFPLWVRSELAWLRSRPDPYGPAVLSRALDGTEVRIPCGDGTRLRAVSNGVGTPVVLLHGLSQNLDEWTVLWPMLVGAGYRAIAFDIRGHGGSTVGTEGMTSGAAAQDIACVLEHFDVRGGLLAGHSLGGFVTAAFLARHPDLAQERLRGALFVSTFAGVILQGEPGWDPVAASRSGALSLTGWKEAIGYGMAWAMSQSGLIGWWVGTDAGHVLSRGMMGDQPYYSAVQASLRMMAAHDFKRSLPIIRAAFYEDYYPRLKDVSIPAIAIGGDADTAARPWHTEAIARAIPNARAIQVRGSGHLINLEAPGALLEALRALAPPEQEVEDRASERAAE